MQLENIVNKPVINQHNISLLSDIHTLLLIYIIVTGFMPLIMTTMKYHGYLSQQRN